VLSDPTIWQEVTVEFLKSVQCQLDRKGRQQATAEDIQVVRETARSMSQSLRSVLAFDIGEAEDD
jgi:hypothetical protein